MDKTPEELRLINEIEALHDELRKLDVYPERIPFSKLGVEGLEIELDAVGEQLKTRKRFLGVN